MPDRAGEIMHVTASFCRREIRRMAKSLRERWLDRDWQNPPEDVSQTQEGKEKGEGREARNSQYPDPRDPKDRILIHARTSCSDGDLPHTCHILRVL